MTEHICKVCGTTYISDEGLQQHLESWEKVINKRVAEVNKAEENLARAKRHNKPE
jgi:hypothetical protein